MSYEIRAMDFGEILDTGFRLLRNHFGLLLAIGLPETLPANFVTYALNASPGAAAVVGARGAGLLMIVVGPLASAATIYALSESYLGRGTTFGEAISEAFGILLPLLGTALLTTIAIVVGFVLLIVPGIYLAFAFLLVYQVVVIERRYAVDAMSRSRELMRGHFLRAFGILIVVGLLSIVLSAAGGFVAIASPLVGVVVNSVVQAIYTAFNAAVLLVLYFDIRCRKEAFDLEHLASSVAGHAVAGRPI